MIATRLRFLRKSYLQLICKTGPTPGPFLVLVCFTSGYAECSAIILFAAHFICIRKTILQALWLFPAYSFKSMFFVSVMSMQPGAWVMAKGGLLFMTMD